MKTDDEALQLLQNLAEKTTRTLRNHAAALQLANENLVAAKKLMDNYGAGIRANREALEGLTALVNAQTRAFNIMRDALVMLWEDRFGKDSAPRLPDAGVN